MNYKIEKTNNNGRIGRLENYSQYLAAASDMRKENISIVDLCKKLNTQRNTIFRIEHAEVDPRLSSVISYLEGFNYHIEFVPNEKTETKAEPKKRKYKPDFATVVNGTDILIENIDLNKAKKDKRLRIELMMYLLQCMKSDMGEDEE